VKIKELREAKGIGQARLAEVTGVTQAAIAKWESGAAYPRADKLPIIAKELGCTIDDLFDRNPIPAAG